VNRAGTVSRAREIEYEKVSRLWLWPVVLTLYAGYAWSFFYIEPIARNRFRVPSELEINSIADHRANVRAAALRNRRLEEVEAWPRFQAYRLFEEVVGVVGVLLMTALGARIVWRGVARTSIAKAKLMVLGVLLILLLALGLFGAPPLFANRIAEGQLTHFAGDEP